MKKNIKITGKYITWMHELTLLGYTQEIVFLTRDSDLVQDYYDSGKTPAEALDEYMKLKGIVPLSPGNNRIYPR